MGKVIHNTFAKNNCTAFIMLNTNTLEGLSQPLDPPGKILFIYPLQPPRWGGIIFY
jgi:hypothetical protein